MPELQDEAIFTASKYSTTVRYISLVITLITIQNFYIAHFFI